MNTLRVRIVFAVAIILMWQAVYMSGIFPKLMFPSVPMICSALSKAITHDRLISMTAYSLLLIVKGLVIGVCLAFLLSALSILDHRVHAIYDMTVSVCDLIPGVALIPLAILWIGIGEGAVIFIIVHSMLWPLSRSIMDGFADVPRMYVESGRNMGLSGFRLVLGIYLPASFSRILSGLRVGWARAWRGLISTEMIFGTTSNGAGIGWFIFMKRNNIDIAGVFAALIIIIVIGLAVDRLLFGVLENITVRKWGMLGGSGTR